MDVSSPGVVAPAVAARGRRRLSAHRARAVDSDRHHLGDRRHGGVRAAAGAALADRPDLARQAPAAGLDGGRQHKYLLGTDAFGRDILSRLIYGARVSLIVALLALTAGGGIGLPVGIVAGYVGGAVDSILMRLVDAAFTFPAILFALLLAVTMGQGLGTLVIAISLLLWASFARVIRGEVLSLRQRDFVALAKVRGCSSPRIMLTHILPNVLNTFMVLVTLNIGVVIIAEATLSFLGAGIPPPTPTWGLMISEGRGRIAEAWWVALIPGIAITPAGAVGQPVRRLAARPARSEAAPAMSGETVLEVRDLHTHFFLRRGVVKAVDGVSFSLQRGEVLGLVGESGCGKSLTALSLMRLLPKGGARTIKGEVLLDGENILERTPAEMREIRGRRISMVLQDPQTSLNPVFSIGDQLREAIERRRKGASRRGDEGGGGGAAPRRDRRAGAAHRPVSAPDERRHEAARGRRHRHQRRARGADRRRADHRARRHHPAPVPEAAEAPAGRDRHGDPVHHPRFRRGRPHVRPRGGDVCRPHRRVRAGAADLRGAAASLHPRADRLGAQDDRRRPAGSPRSRASRRR